MFLHEGFFPEELLRLAQFGEDVCLIGAALYSKTNAEPIPCWIQPQCLVAETIPNLYFVFRGVQYGDTH